ncbi:uncharacterized protein LOC124666836 isoform X1 [Lolium rigidum]|uniref:uncharacterized protein LOC124666836 isoform X1 n=1 Tax=Lolium rigidum TaxID=89674 RepID=UPI001F5DAEB4|nr:uncharacterized protein LOC124666836 isoform X1 [Lolium rigidum]
MLLRWRGEWLLHHGFAPEQRRGSVARAVALDLEGMGTNAAGRPSMMLRCFSGGSSPCPVAKQHWFLVFGQFAAAMQKLSQLDDRKKDEEAQMRGQRNGSNTFFIRGGRRATVQDGGEQQSSTFLFRRRAGTWTS